MICQESTKQGTPARSKDSHTTAMFPEPPPARANEKAIPCDVAELHGVPFVRWDGADESVVASPIKEGNSRQETGQSTYTQGQKQQSRSN